MGQVNSTPMPARVADFVVSDFGATPDGKKMAGFVLRGLTEGMPFGNTLVMFPLDRAERLHAELGKAIKNAKAHTIIQPPAPESGE